MTEEFMTQELRNALREVTDYLEAILDDCIKNGLPQDIAADIRLAIKTARDALAGRGPFTL